MNIVESLREGFELSLPSQIAVLLIVTVLFWALGFPTIVQHAKAAYMSQVSDTLSDSNNVTVSKHVISFTNATSTTAGQTIKIAFDPDTFLFTEFYSSATTT